MPNYKSGFERTIAATLKQQKASFEYETLTLPFVIHHTYRPDIIFPNGVIVELKGVLNKHDNQEARKLIAARDQNPHLDIRIVFSDAHAKIPRTKMTHAKWAERYKFKWADGSIPEDWYK